MLVLDYVNVQENHAVLEGRYLENGNSHASVEVIVGKTSAIIGMVTHDDGKVKILGNDACVEMVGIMSPPALVMHAKSYLDQNAGGTIRYVRMPGLFNWLTLTLGIGVHEYTTEYEVAYAKA